MSASFRGEDLHISPQKQAHIYAAGLLTIITLGTFAAIGLCLAALWLLVQCATLLLQSMIEALSSIGATYQAADPLVRFLILAGIGYTLYRLVRHVAPARRITQ